MTSSPLPDLDTAGGSCDCQIHPDAPSGGSCRRQRARQVRNLKIKKEITLKKHLCRLTPQNSSLTHCLFLFLTGFISRFLIGSLRVQFSQTHDLYVSTLTGAIVDLKQPMVLFLLFSSFPIINTCHRKYSWRGFLSRRADTVEGKTVYPVETGKVCVCATSEL